MVAAVWVVRVLYPDHSFLLVYRGLSAAAASQVRAVVRAAMKTKPPEERGEVELIQE